MGIGQLSPWPTLLAAWSHALLVLVDEAKEVTQMMPARELVPNRWFTPAYIKKRTKNKELQVYLAAREHLLLQLTEAQEAARGQMTASRSFRSSRTVGTVLHGAGLWLT